VRASRPSAGARLRDAVFKGLSHVALPPLSAISRTKTSRRSADGVGDEADSSSRTRFKPTRPLAAMVRADERMKDAFPRITLPVLILHGTADKATKPRAGANSSTTPWVSTTRR